MARRRGRPHERIVPGFEAWALRAAGAKWKEIGDRYGVSMVAAYNAAKRYEERVRALRPHFAEMAAAAKESDRFILDVIEFERTGKLRPKRRVQ